MEKLNLQMTQVLGHLLAVPQEARDDGWHNGFLATIPTASLASFEPQIENGPDSFPYFQLAMPNAGAFTPFSIAHILDDCISNGVGAVIHTSLQRDEQPAWVFTLGDLVAYKLFQDFQGDPKVYNNPEPPPADDVDRSLLRAVPNDAYFPAGARAAMGRFMRGPYQHPDPRIGLVSGASLRPRESLMVNLRARHYGGDMNKINAAMNYLTWFIPKSYSIMPLPDDWSDDEMLPI